MGVGGIGSNIWGNKSGKSICDYRQGYRVWGVSGIGCCITSNGGGYGGSSGLYFVNKKEK